VCPGERIQAAQALRPLGYVVDTAFDDVHRKWS
jgi:hypothetical protein